MSIKLVQKTKSELWESDLLNNEGLRLFYLSKEALKAYSSMLGLNQRRDMAAQIADMLEIFLAYHYSAEQISFIEEIFTRNKHESESSKIIDPHFLSHLKTLDREGVELLNISEGIDIKMLKTLYRKASKIYHPDKGGSVEKMQKVNKAFTLFYDAMENELTFKSDAQQRGSHILHPESWNDWLYSNHLILSCIYGDSYAADKAMDHLKKAYEYIKSNSSPYIGRFAENLVGIGGVLDRTCRVLGRFKMQEDLYVASGITSFIIDRIVKDWTPKSSDDFKPSRDMYPTQTKLNEEYGVKIVLMHADQAQNAYRLGKIDRKRFEEAMKRFDRRARDEEETSKIIDKYFNEHNFITRLSNSSYPIDLASHPFILPPMFYQERFDHLEDEQKVEYLKCFNKGGNAKLFKKYSKIRTQEILLGLIQNYSSLDLKLLKQEVEYFSLNCGDCFDGYMKISEFMDYLENLDPENRNQRLAALNALDDPEPRSFSLVVSISITLDGNIELGSSAGSKRRVEVSDDYIEFAKSNVLNINGYKNTGEVQSSCSERHNMDYAAVEKYSNGTVAKKWEKIWLYTKNPSPEQVIEAAEPYLLGLLEVGKTMHPKHTGELQIGYAINRITVAYQKVKQWDKIQYWGGLFFQLPRNYRDRSSYSEQQAIKKRLESANLKI